MIEFMENFRKEFIKSYLSEFTKTEIKEIRTLDHSMKYDKKNEILYHKFLINDEILVEIEEVCKSHNLRFIKQMSIEFNKIGYYP